MRIIRTNSFKRDFKKLPEKVKRKTEEKLKILITNLHYPSLGAKKVKGTKNIWEARITQSYRLTFQIINNILLLRRISTHNILKTP